jgi:protein regulator of cytokinesis 1
MIEEAHKMINSIRQMESSLYGKRLTHEYQGESDDLKVTFPLSRCLQVLKEKHINVGRAHKERFEQVKSRR